MHQSPFSAIFEHHTHPSYQMRVRDTVYLWGSIGISKNQHYDKPLLLHCRNDRFGSTVNLGTLDDTGTQTPIGYLLPGECISIPIQDITGISAFCSTGESIVACLIKETN